LKGGLRIINNKFLKGTNIGENKKVPIGVECLIENNEGDLNLIIGK
jgi:hypothetical protein